MLAALGIADLRGVDALTMRGLADALGVQAPVLYRDFAGKEELLEEMADAVVAVALEGPEPAGRWDARAAERARRLRRALLTRRDGARIVGGRTVPRRSTLRFADALVGDLLDAGLAQARALQFGAVVHSFVLGEAMEQQGTADGAASDPRLRQALAGDPALRSLGPGTPLAALVDFDARFELGLAALLTAAASHAGDPGQVG